jgi:hypothetical protein
MVVLVTTGNIEFIWNMVLLGTTGIIEFICNMVLFILNNIISGNKAFCSDIVVVYLGYYYIEI